MIKTIFSVGERWAKSTRPVGRWRAKNPRHRRRIKTEETAKVVDAVWGKEFIKFIVGHTSASSASSANS